MRKGQYSKRKCLTGDNKNCVICRIRQELPIGFSEIASKILKRKYLQQSQWQKQIHTINKLIFPVPNNRFNIDFSESLKQVQRVQRMQQYGSLNFIKHHIQTLILQRSKKINAVLHFGSDTYNILKHRFIKLKKIREKAIRFKKISIKDIEAVTTDSAAGCPTPIKHRGKVQRIPIEGETPQLRRMTRVLSKMVQPFNQNFSFQSSMLFQLMNEANGHILDLTQLQLDQKFRRQIEQNISFIPKKKPIERLNTVGAQHIEPNYGLKIGIKAAESRTFDTKTKKKVSTKKSRMLFMKQNLSPNQRIYTDYDCELIVKNRSVKRSDSKASLSRLKKTSNSKTSSMSKPKLLKKLK